MSAYARLGTADEILVCALRAIKNAKGMPLINENNLIATCDHLENLVQQARIEVKIARRETPLYYDPISHEDKYTIGEEQ